MKNFQVFNSVPAKVKRTPSPPEFGSQSVRLTCQLVALAPGTAGATAGPAGPARASNDTARLGAGMPAVLEDLNAIDEYVVHPCRQLIGLLEGRMVGDRCGIEYDNVGIIARVKRPALPDPDITRRKRGQTAHGVLERRDMLIAHLRLMAWWSD